MKPVRLIALISLLASAAMGAAGQKAFPWMTDETKAFAKAKEAGKPVMLYFTTDWCGFCKVMEGEAFMDPAVQAQAERYIPVKLDAEKEGAEMAKKCNVSSYPTFVFIKPDGKVLGAITGYLKPRDFEARVKHIFEGKSERERLEAILAKNPDDPAANCAFASLLINEGRHEDAAKHIERGRKAKYQGTEMAKALTDLAQFMLNIDAEKSLPLFEEALACRDTVTTSTTFELYLYAAGMFKDSALTRKIANQMANSQEASPEVRKSGVQTIRYMDLNLKLTNPDALTDHFLKEIQGVDPDQRDPFNFINLFNRDASIYQLVTTDEGRKRAFTDRESLLKTMWIDVANAKYAVKSRDIKTEGDLATVRLECEVDWSLSDGTTKNFDQIIHLNLIQGNGIWRIVSFISQDIEKR